MSEIFRTKYQNIDYVMIPRDEYEKMRQCFNTVVDSNKTLFDQNNELIEKFKQYKNEIQLCLNEIKNYNGECDYCIMNKEES